MSFRRFIYYCALCGGAAAFVAWALGEHLETGVLEDGEKGLFLGIMLGAILAVVDSSWNFSWRQLPVAVLRVLVAGTVGCFAGFLGGLIGSWVLSNTNHEMLAAVAQVFGWTLTGLLIGASIGLFDLVLSVLLGRNSSGAVKKVFHGLIGGGGGGLLGGVLFVLLEAGLGKLNTSSLKTSSLWTPGALGFVVLGLCIGLLVGLAQVILKQAWLKVEKGFRPGRELIVSKEQVVIGRGEACDIGLFGDNGVERTHARILRKGDRYLLIDADTPGGTYLNGQRIDGPTPLQAGDEIGVGRALIRFGERQKR
ncbi:MAG TPA: FHA domain-containing protein [Gemmataceae bacterium]|nr:FHA domain-containing protein [Gemmataceae bacterium]